MPSLPLTLNVEPDSAEPFGPERLDLSSSTGLVAERPVDRSHGRGARRRLNL
jgi:hypothetical protein